MWNRADCRPRIGLALLLVWLSTPLAADSGLLSGSLGRWLDTQVLPELGKVLGDHPRFKGETIRMVSLDNGQPTDRTSELHQAVKAHLTQALLRTSGVRIAWSEHSRSTCGVVDPAVYLLGIEIERDGSRYHKLNISMIDVAESLWVSGVNHSWQGRLTAAEGAALRRAAGAAPEGTLDHPFPAQDSAQIASTLHEHLRCAHPDGLDGLVYLAPADSATLNRIMASLRSKLATAPLTALTSEIEDADWVLSLAAVEAGPGSGTGNRQLDLLLTDRRDDLTQQIAALYVDGLSSPASRTADTRLALSTGLLSGMRLEPALDEGICAGRRQSAGQCAEVSFDLQQPAYLFVLSSSSRELSSTSCDSRLTTASAGERRFRVRVTPGPGDLPDAGLYALAVTDRSAASELSRHIRTGVCSRPLSRSTSWLGELDRLVAAHQSAIEWQAIHLSHTGNGIDRH